MPAYRLRTRLSDMEPSSYRAEGGNALSRELIGEHLSGLNLQRISILHSQPNCRVLSRPTSAGHAATPAPIRP